MAQIEKQPKAAAKPAAAKPAAKGKKGAAAAAAPQEPQADPVQTALARYGIIMSNPWDTKKQCAPEHSLCHACLVQWCGSWPPCGMVLGARDPPAPADLESEVQLARSSTSRITTLVVLQHCRCRAVQGRHVHSLPGLPAVTAAPRWKPPPCCQS